jgi:DNA polymerase-3 subunit epsilon
MSDVALDSDFWVLDTETTGFEPRAGHKLIEIAGVKVSSGMITGENFQFYVDPLREIPSEAVEVHNLTREDVIELGNGKIFKDVADDIIHLLSGQTIVFHNAPFDMNFLDYELEAVDLPKLSDVAGTIIDSLQYAKTIHPSKKNNLDALAKRYGVDSSNRNYHGALLDSEILANTFLAMTKAQSHLSVSQITKSMKSKRREVSLSDIVKPIPKDLSVKLKALSVDDNTKEEHLNYLKSIDDQLGW